MQEEHHSAVDGSAEPEQHVDKIDPDGVFHADDTRVAFGVFVDVEFAEGAEEGHIEDEHERIPREKRPRLNEWEHEHDG